MSFLKYHFLFFFWLLLIFAESSFPAEFYPKVDIINADKIVHLGIYGLLALFCYVSLIHQNKFYLLKKYPVYYAVVITGIYGITDELHQLFVPNRNCDFYDWLADFSGGVIMGLIIKYYLQKKFSLFKTV
jgi:VanZ family protein